MRKVLADTVEYCKQRQQFGQPIGSFQVLQHRMVDMYMEVEQAVAAVYLAVLNLEASPDVRARAVSAAKATIGRAARFVGQQAVQLHGGMGMTEELAIGHYFKRLTALQYEFGSTDYHVARYASISAPKSPHLR
jgi:alkylation response protein AidB-like acyl-CoA dehydrogenase